MEIRAVLRKKNDPALEEFSYARNQIAGEVSTNEIFKDGQTAFYLVNEFRWLNVRLAEEFPALAPAIITCLPTMISVGSDHYFMHTFVSSNVEHFVKKRLKTSSPANLTVTTFARGKAVDQSDRVQQGQQAEVEQKMEELGLRKASVRSIRVPRFQNVILFQKMLYFFNGKDQLVDTRFAIELN
jgi:hypothetical protein